MRTSTAYFAGAGTVVAAIIGGVGGGLLIADMISPKSPKQGTELTRLERRMSPEPIQTAAAPSEPVPSLAAPLPSAPNAAAPNTAVAPVPAPAAAQPEQPQPQTEAANSQPAPAQPAAPRPVEASTAGPPAASEPQPAPAAQPARAQTAASEDDAHAKAKDTDVKRGTETRRVERRQQWGDKRQQWAEKRRYQQRQDRDRPDRELRAVEVERVGEDPESRQEFAAEPARVEMPLIRLFGAE
jgi:hypothetical protein